MLLQYTSEFSHALQATLATAVIIVLCASFFQLKHRAQLAKIPVIGNKTEEWRKKYIVAARHIYLENCKKFKSQVFNLITSDGLTTIVVPPVFLPELRKLPDDVISFPKAVQNTLETKYTRLIVDGPVFSLIVRTVKADLNPALVRLNDAVRQEVVDAVNKEFGSPADWEKQFIYMKLCNVVSVASGRIIVGPDHCHEKDYMNFSINYTIDAISAQMAVKKLRPWLRPYVGPRLKEVKKLRALEEMTKKYIEPIVEARRKASKDPNYQKPDDMLQWFINRSEGDRIATTERITEAVLTIIFAAIHTTTTTVTIVMYTLASFPEYVPELRQEIRSVLEENGGDMNLRALQSMVKLDSFMKESIRFFPMTTTAFSRKVLKGFQLSNGQYIPRNSYIEVSSLGVYFDEEKYPDSTTFDGFRFAKIREGLSVASEKARHLFVTSNEQSLNFGYGSHACPGRFFANNEIKMLLATFILNYDVKNEDGRKGIEGRIPNIEVGRNSNPDVTKPLLVRRAQV